MKRRPPQQPPKRRIEDNWTGHLLLCSAALMSPFSLYAVMVSAFLWEALILTNGLLYYLTWRSYARYR